VAVHYGASEQQGREVVESLAGSGHVLVQADLRDADHVRSMVDDAAAQLGTLDVLVNNAGVFYAHPITTTSYDEWQRAWRDTLDVNLVGAANATWCEVQHMKRGARIVNVGSRGAFRTEPDSPAYGASKAAMASLGQSLAKSLGSRGIAVTTIAPGFVDTDMAAETMATQGDEIRGQSPFGRIPTAEEVASAVVFLASPDAEWASGAVLDFNGASWFRL
jgi:NAD(P)-dependent dehydrogenase (short-subunit alcohol dehydrogenase family)